MEQTKYRIVIIPRNEHDINEAQEIINSIAQALMRRNPLDEPYYYIENVADEEKR